MFRSLLSIVLLMFAVFALDELGITSANMAEDETKVEAEAHTEPIAETGRFTDRIVAKRQAQNS